MTQQVAVQVTTVVRPQLFTAAYVSGENGATANQWGTNAAATVGTTGDLVVTVNGLSAGLSSELIFTVNYIGGLPCTASVEEWQNGVYATLGSQSVTGAGVVHLPFVPHGGGVRLRVSEGKVFKKPTTLVMVSDGRCEQRGGVEYKAMLVRVESKGSDRCDFGYNGQMKTNEIAGVGNFISFIARGYDPRRAGFISIDPRADEYPFQSPYVFGANSPIQFIEENGEGPGGAIVAVSPAAQGGAMVGAIGANYLRQVLRVVQRNNVLTSAIVTVVNFPNAIREAHDHPQANRGSAQAIAWQRIRKMQAQEQAWGNIGGAIGAMGGRIGRQAYSDAMSQAAAHAAADKPADNKKKGQSLDPAARRVTLRKGTKEQIQQNAPRNKDSRALDPNDGEPIPDGQADIGHKPGNEWWTRQQMHRDNGSTRKEVIDAENDPNLYQIENRSNNRSHKYEQG